MSIKQLKDETRENTEGRYPGRLASVSVSPSIKNQSKGLKIL